MSDTKLVSVPIEVTVGDETFKILPFGFEMQTLISARLFTAFAKAGFTAGDAISFDDLVVHAHDVMFDAACAAIGKPRSYLRNLDDFDAGLRIAEAVYTANAEVFAKNVIPALKTRFQKLVTDKPGVLSALMKSLQG